MCVSKIFKTYEEQIEILKSRNLIIDEENKDAIIEILRNYNYYSIINGYSSIFQSQKDLYDDNIHFFHLIYSYVFDKNLKELFLAYIQIIEKNLSSKIAYEFSKVHGDNHLVYLNKDSFELVERLDFVIDDFIEQINDQITNSKKEYVKHYINKYGTIPLWVLINDFSLGQKSTLFKIMKNSEKTSICKDYCKEIRPNVLENFLHTLSFYRNICAHDDLLFKIKVENSKMTNLDIHKKLSIPTKNGVPICGKYDVFSLIIIFKYLLKEDEFSMFFGLLEKIIDNYKTPKPMYKDRVLEIMGFPPLWKSIKDIQIQTNKYSFI